MRAVSFRSCCAALLTLLFLPEAVHAQQKIGYIDSQYILEQTPEYATVEQQMDRLVAQWEEEIRAEQAAVDELVQEFQARELLYTDEERREKREAIAQARQAVEALRTKYFGPEGQLYTRQQQLMRPIQERVLTAVEEVAQAEGYDYVLDKSGELLLMFAREEYDLNEAVLRELGIDVDASRIGSR